MHQRREEHVDVPQQPFRLQTRGHGAVDGRSTESHEPTDQSQYPTSHALAGQGRAAQRFPLLPLFR